MKKKKLLISLGSVAAIVAPIAAVVSCGHVGYKNLVELKSKKLTVEVSATLTNKKLNLKADSEIVKRIIGKIDGKATSDVTSMKLTVVGHKAVEISDVTKFSSQLDVIVKAKKAVKDAEAALKADKDNLDKQANVEKENFKLKAEVTKLPSLIAELLNAQTFS